MTTTHTFTQAGFRTMPIGKKGYKLVRNAETLKKYILDEKGNVVSFKDAMPSDWTAAFGRQRVEHSDAPLGGLICGKLHSLAPGEIQVIAMDCDDANSWKVLRALDPDYKYVFESIGKPGGTVLYRLPETLNTVYQYSVRNQDFQFEYMALRESGSNAMVYLPTKANETKTNVDKTAKLDYPPPQLIALVKSLEPSRVAATPQEYNSVTRAPYNAPLVAKYVKAVRDASTLVGGYGKLEHHTPVAEKIYRIFTPMKYRTTEHYKKKGWVHPNDAELIPFSDYIVGVSAIAGADASISQDLYLDFMQAINAQIDDPYQAKRYLDEVISPMVSGKAKIAGVPIWRYEDKWDKESITIVSQYGDSLEYFTSEQVPNEYFEFNHTTGLLNRMQGVRALLDRVYAIDSDPSAEPPAKSLVKKLKLVQEINTVQQDPGLYVNEEGRMVINTEKACYPLSILRNPGLYTPHVDESNLYVQAFNVFLSHLFNNEESSIKFMKQVISFHGRHLKDIAVIIYMVGVGGAGKSHFAYMLEMLFGSNTTRRPGHKHLTSQYNDFLENCAILVLSETGDAPKREREGIKAVLKQVTGERAIDIEPKFRPMKKNVPMFILPVLLANTPWYQEDVNDRRLFPVMPMTGMMESEAIRTFEAVHGVRIVEFIIEGITSGVISKYLSQFCPTVLPPVPTVTTGFSMSDTIDDPILQVKRLIGLKQYYELITLMEEFSVQSFFEFMNIPSSDDRTKHYLYRDHLTDLVKNMREGAIYPLDSVISKAFTPGNWLEMSSSYSSNTRAQGPTSYKRVGRYRWAVDGLLEAFTQWSVDSINSLGED